MPVYPRLRHDGDSSQELDQSEHIRPVEGRPSYFKYLLKQFDSISAGVVKSFITSISKVLMSNTCHSFLESS